LLPISSAQQFCNQKVIVMDDEKYFTFSHGTLTGMSGFWTDDFENTVGKFLHREDQAVAITKCRPKMVKFIEKHHKNDETIFWPDLISCYYAKKTLEWLEQSAQS
jgi:hypothetical protein